MHNTPTDARLPKLTLCLENASRTFGNISRFYLSYIIAINIPGNLFYQGQLQIPTVLPSRCRWNRKTPIKLILHRLHRRFLKLALILRRATKKRSITSATRWRCDARIRDSEFERLPSLTLLRVSDRRASCLAARERMNWFGPGSLHIRDGGR